MTEQEKLLFEQYITFDMIDHELGMKYLNYYLNTRDFNKPIGKTDEYIKSELVMMYFKKQSDGSIHISGAYTLLNEGEPENRSFSGYLYDEKGKIVFEIDVFRHNDTLETEEKEYNICEMFSPNRDKTTHKLFSSYRTNEGLENFLEPKHQMSEEQLKELIKKKTTNSKSM